MKRTVTTINYMVDIPSKKLLKIIEAERGLVPTTLYESLKKIEGVENVDYDGHFGPYIWITLDYQFDNGLTWLSIEQRIKDYLKTLRKE